ncbi:MAG TPA: condensation domain-containing protein [Pyrinomonadaceae bacterium]|nr:condensation domain-containing protein [Pyrinomonadaceae bacterium]
MKTDRLALLKNLSPAKRALLLKSLRAEAAHQEEPDVIARRTGNAPAPLSFAQQRLWFLDQLDPNNSAYNIARAIRLTGPLDRDALERTINEIVRRHEALRTSFQTVNGEAVQVIAPTQRVALKVTHLPERSREELEAEARRLAIEHARQPFNLSTGPLLRVGLLRLAEEEHIFLLVMHHIISDAWSEGLFVWETTALYEAFVKGQPSPLPELPIQYADFAIWQRERMQGEVLDKHLAYWKRQLGGQLPVLELPTDRPRPSAQTFRGTYHHFMLSRDASDALKALARREDVTLFMTLLATFQTLLYSYTGQQDVIVGTPIAGRNRVEIEGLIGLFINILALRVNLSGDPPFRELLGRVREVVLGAYEHQDLPFEKLVAELQLSRDASRASIVQVGFDLHNEPRPPLGLSNLKLNPVELETGTATADLILYMREKDEGLQGLLEYNTDLFDAATIERIAERFSALVEAVAANPEQRLSSLRDAIGLAASPAKVKSGKAETFDDIYEHSNLTKYQLLIWFGQKLNPQMPIYINAFNFLIKVPLEREHFERAFATLVNSSDALRTTFDEVGGWPRQRLVESLPYKMDYVDLSHHADPHAAARAWSDERLQIPFDFGERLFDSALIKLSEQETIWFLNIHHIICDAWSYTVAFKLMSELYGRSLAGRLEERVELPHFQDYIDYERALRGSVQYAEAEAFWKKRLGAETEPLRFYGRVPDIQTTRVQRVSCDIGVERTKKLKQVAQREELFTKSLNATLANIEAAVLCAYLYRISGNRLISIGLPYHNRRTKPFQETIGLFMQIIPIQIPIESDDTFVTLVRKIARENVEGLRYREFPIGNPSRKRAYEVECNFISASFGDFNGAPAQINWLHPGHGNESLALQLHDFGKVGSLTAEFDFHRDVFDDEQRPQAVRHFLQILDAFLEDPHCQVNRTDLISMGVQKERISSLEDEVVFDFD